MCSFAIGCFDVSADRQLLLSSTGFSGVLLSEFLWLGARGGGWAKSNMGGVVSLFVHRNMNISIADEGTEHKHSSLEARQSESLIHILRGATHKILVGYPNSQSGQTRCIGGARSQKREQTLGHGDKMLKGMAEA